MFLKSIPQLLLILLITTGMSHTTCAQSTVSADAEMRQADSLQRRMLRDSLQMSDTTITLLYALRDRYLKKAAAVRSDTSLSAEKQNAINDALKSNTNASIRVMLGDGLYDRYTLMIRRRLDKRRLVKSVLAGGSTQ
jgi:exopolysaccharide biosynthesis protein